MSTPVAFVTGATGLVGSHLLYDLLQKGYRVKALKRPQSATQQVQKIFNLYTDNADALFRQIEWIDGELLNFPSMTEAVDGCSQVYFCDILSPGAPANAKRRYFLVQNLPISHSLPNHSVSGMKPTIPSTLRRD